MLVRALMRKVRSLAPNDNLATAFRVLAASGARHAPVVDDGHLVGVVSEWDLLRAWVREQTRVSQVRQVMTGNVHTVGPNEQLAAVAQRFVDERVGSLPVVEHDKLIGVITVTDIVAAIGREHFATPRTKARARRPAKAKARGTVRKKATVR